jgi:DNA-binding transcriptional MerR regulator
MPDISEIPSKRQYKAGEVCQYTDTQPYVLQFWESEFPQLKPRKSASGQAVYTKKDIATVLRIKQLIYEEDYTITAARKQLDREKRRKGGIVPKETVAPKKRVHPERERPEKSLPVEQEGLFADTVSRDRYEDALEEIAHMKLQLKDASADIRRLEGELAKLKQSRERASVRSDKAIERLEQILEMLS